MPDFTVRPAKGARDALPIRVTRDSGLPPLEPGTSGAFAEGMHSTSMREHVMNLDRVRRLAPVIGLVGGAASVAAVYAVAPAAHADVPPSERIYSRTQTWTCEGLGVFEALYSPWGNNPHVKWLSPDGGRDGGVQVTIVSGDITLTLGGETFHFVFPKNPPVRDGQAQHVCSIYGVNGPDSITGTSIIAVIPRSE
jgi:hypothetical protein